MCRSKPWSKPLNSAIPLMIQDSVFVTSTQFCTQGQLNLTNQHQQHHHTWTLADYFMYHSVDQTLRVQLLLQTPINH